MQLMCEIIRSSTALVGRPGTGNEISSLGSPPVMRLHHLGRPQPFPAASMNRRVGEAGKCWLWQPCPWGGGCVRWTSTAHISPDLMLWRSACKGGRGSGCFRKGGLLWIMHGLCWSCTFERRLGPTPLQPSYRCGHTLCERTVRAFVGIAAASCLLTTTSSNSSSRGRWGTLGLYFPPQRCWSEAVSR